MAGDGEGTLRAFGAHFGKATCYPLHVKNTTFSETPPRGRVRFSRGPTTAEVMFGLCSIIDDGSISRQVAGTGSGSSERRRGLEEEGKQEEEDDDDGSFTVLTTSVRHEWPAEILSDCAVWASLGYPDDYDGSGGCLWWLRTYDTLRPAITDRTRRGMVKTGVPGTHYAAGACEAFDLGAGDVDGRSYFDNNVLACRCALIHRGFPRVSPCKVLSCMRSG